MKGTSTAQARVSPSSQPTMCFLSGQFKRIKRMSQGKDFTTDLHSQMVAKEKHAGVGDRASRRPGELLTSKKFPNRSKNYSAENQGHNPLKSVYKETPGTSQEEVGETHAKSQRHGEKKCTRSNLQDKHGWDQAGSLVTWSKEKVCNESTVGRTQYGRLPHGKLHCGLPSSP